MSNGLAIFWYLHLWLNVSLFLRKTKLKNLNHKFNVPSTRLPPPEQEAAQLVLLAVSEDIAGRKGTGALTTQLRNQGHAIPRYALASIRIS